MAKCADKVIDPAPIIKALAERCLDAKGMECSILGDVIDMLRSAPAVHNAPYWATEAAYKNGYEAAKAEIVHCKDCHNCTKSKWCNMLMMNVKEEWFCYHGKKKDN